MDSDMEGHSVMVPMPVPAPKASGSPPVPGMATAGITVGGDAVADARARHRVAALARGESRGGWVVSLSGGGWAAVRMGVGQVRAVEGQAIAARAAVDGSRERVACYRRKKRQGALRGVGGSEGVPSPLGCPSAAWYTQQAQTKSVEANR